MTFVGVDTYLVGHSLESDLRALKIVHQRLIDTSELYPSARGAPFKVKKPTVASQLVIARPTLERFIRCYDCVTEDACCCFRVGGCYPEGFSVSSGKITCTCASIVLGNLRKHGQMPLIYVTKLITVV